MFDRRPDLSQALVCAAASPETRFNKRYQIDAGHSQGRGSTHRTYSNNRSA